MSFTNTVQYHNKWPRSFETGQLIINFDGRLNSAQLIVDLSKIKDSDQEK